MALPSINPVSPKTDLDALRALIAEADCLGRDSRGYSWLIIRTTDQVIDYLSTVDAAIEGDEDDTQDEEDDAPECNGDVEFDNCDDEPDGRESGLMAPTRASWQRAAQDNDAQAMFMMGERMARTCAKAKRYGRKEK